MNNVSKILSTSILASILTVGIAATANAHNAKMHMKKAEKAKCSVMEKMDKKEIAKKMKTNDIVMMAMMKKCAKQAKESMEHEHEDGSEEHQHEHNEGSEEHQHH